VVCVQIYFVYISWGYEYKTTAELTFEEEGDSYMRSSYSSSRGSNISNRTSDSVRSAVVNPLSAP
jgi:hypothetical protein